MSNRIQRLRIPVLLLLLALILASCNGQTANDSPPLNAATALQAWIDAPLDGSLLSEGPQTIVVSVAIGDQGPPDTIMIEINGQLVAELTPIVEGFEGQSQYAYGEFLWNVPGQGAFDISAWGEANGEKGPITQASVTVGDQVAFNQDPPELSDPLNCEGEFLAPQLTAPIDGHVILNQTPYEFKWLMTNCKPKAYDLKVFYAPHTNGPTIVDADFETDGATYEHNELLEPVTTYDWRLIAIGWDSDSNWIASDWAQFTTGPVCERQTILAPNLVSPENFATVTSPPGNPNSVAVSIAYPDANCTPAHYEIDISPDPSFESANYGVIPSYPNYASDQQNIPGSLVHSATSAPFLNDCTQYFWRARAMTDPDDPVNGEFTPSLYSDSYSFFTNLNGTCPTLPEESGFPYVNPKQDSNCRASDYTASQNLATLFADQPATILAINPEGTHLRVLDPQFDIRCWVWVDLVDIIMGGEPVSPEVAFGFLPKFNAPDPTPTPTEAPRATNTPTPSGSGAPQCSDGVDNDGDGLTDYSALGAGDPQCTDASDNDESS